MVSKKTVDSLRSSRPELVQRATAAIRAEVAAYAGPDGGRRHLKIETAVGVVTREFVDLAGGKARPGRDAVKMFSSFGWSEGAANRNLEALWAAFGVMTREIWVDLHRIGLELYLDVAESGVLGDLLFVLAGRLREAVESGFREGAAARDTDGVVARDQFIRHLLGDEDSAHLESLGTAAGWTPPGRALVFVAEAPSSVVSIEVEMSSAGAFVMVDGHHLIVLCDERSRHDDMTLMRVLVPATPISVSPPVPASLIPSAIRLSRRALDLIERKVIARAGIVDCANYESELWLQAEPLLRERAVARLLGPLEVLSPQRRQTLAMTLVLKLEHHASAPVIGEQLGVHPQTVRYRLRQLDDLLSPHIDDPKSAFLMLMALKAAMPLWAADASQMGETKG